MNVRHTIQLVLAVGGVWVASVASGQGIITDGDARFEFNASATVGSADFQPDGIDDHVYQNWWWYRIDTAPQEFSLPYPPPIQSYIGNVAVMEWPMPNFHARLTVILRDGPMPGEATVTSAMTVTNTTAADMRFNLYSYADYDVAGTAGDDSAVLISSERMAIRDGSGNFCEYLGAGADHWEVDTFANLRTRLDDPLITNLGDIGLPFGPADFTGAFQWTFPLPANESRTFLVGLSANAPAIGGPILKPFGSCPGPVEVQVHGATPLGLVAIVYGTNPGPYVVPAGPCAGITLDVAPPFLPGAPTYIAADPTGRVFAGGGLPPALCGATIVQAVDATTCLVTNSVIF